MRRNRPANPPPPEPAQEAPKPTESVRGDDPEAPSEREHQRVTRQDHEKARPKNTGREGA